MDHIPQPATSSELESVGLSASERIVYEALVDGGSASTADLRAMMPDSSGGLSRILGDLEAKGLVNRVPGRPVKYVAVPPEVGLELLLVNREHELRRARLAARELAERFNQERAGRDVAGLIEIVKGERAVAERYGAVHRTARQQLRVLSRPPYVVKSEENRAITAEAHEKNVRARNIVNPSFFDRDADGRLLAAARADIAAGEQIRVMSHVPLKLLVADDHAALIPLEVGAKGIQSAVLFHASALLEALIEVFETCWAIAHPLDLSGPGDDQRGRTGESVTAEERDLLALLTAGIPDGTIARHLGLSHTTLQRRILALKTRLGAATRFQAGLQAAMRGWISDDGAPDGGKPSS